jgi:hypothetical protein
MHVLGHLFRGDDEAHVGVFGLTKRRWDGDIGVQFRDDREVRRGAKVTGLDVLPNGFSWDVLNVGTAGVEFGYFGNLESMPVTEKPALANSTAKGRPT